MPDDIYRQRRVNQADIQAREAAEEAAEMEVLEGLRSKLHAQEPSMPQMPQMPPQMEESIPPSAINPTVASPIKITGNVPPQLQQMLQQKAAATRGMSGMSKMQPQRQQQQQRYVQNDQPFEVQHGDSPALKALVDGLQGSTHLWEEVMLPSKGKFYDGTDGPSNGVITIRPMTGEEEQILATPRFVKRGLAINMIFQRCMQNGPHGPYQPDHFLTIDRTYLLIYLRGISYTPEYDVEVKCPECDKKFGTTINLSELLVDYCPDDYGPPLTGTLPTSGYKFTYHLSRGKDETEVQQYREHQLKFFGDTADDTLLYRTAMLLNDIEGLNDKKELQKLLKQLPINDVAAIRNSVTSPPFGVDTDVQITCPHCYHESEIDLPLEANFFFPQQKKANRTRA